MSIYEEPDSEEEPIILSMEEFRRTKLRPDEPPPEPTDERGDPRPDEAYWAGRNHAMRRSARWAA